MTVQKQEEVPEEEDKDEEPSEGNSDLGIIMPDLNLEIPDMSINMDDVFDRRALSF